MSFLGKLFGSHTDRELKRIYPIVDKIEALEPQFQALSDEELRAKTEEFKQRYQGGEDLDALLPEAFAAVREAAWRVLGMKPFRVQLIGGIVLHQGRIAEMKTGEGKTLVAVLPAYLNALTGEGVHIVTVNDYLARRDSEWMGKVHRFMGLSVGLIVHGLNNDERQAAYNADITYGTNNEMGFDYLRDNMAIYKENMVQRGHVFAIVDEVDSILIDEARTPLIISGQGDESTDLYRQADDFVSRLKVKVYASTDSKEEEDENIDADYVVDEKARTATLTARGVEKAERAFNLENYADIENSTLTHHINQALRAHGIMKRDIDYVVKDGEILIVDEFTGRIMLGRRYSEGLHQAIEAKEHVDVQRENKTLATITFQNYFRLYEKLSGMTGTAVTEAEEFAAIYQLDIVEIPTNKPVVRIDHPDVVFKNDVGKNKAIIEQIIECHEKGQPVLIGSDSIANNERIAAYLQKEGIPFELLNAKNNEREAAIIEKAGEKGAVTLATNMAGRGTDIKLGKGVKELGGLVVIGTARHDSRRVDNQLRGRGGRQGDPGTTQFFVSCEDDLMRIFQGDRIALLMQRLGIDDDMPIRNKAVSKTLEQAQKRIEGFNFDSRKNVVQYDNVINRHRKVVYTMRRRILDGDNIRPEISRLYKDEIAELTQFSSRVNKDFVANFKKVFDLDDDLLETIGLMRKEKDRYKLALAAVEELYSDKELEFGEDTMRKIEREVYLQVLDTLWMQHLENMQHLREGIHWRSVGQRDPLVEYRAESQKLFDGLQRALREEVMKILLSVRLQDVNELSDDNYDTELTKMAESATEKGVNEVSAGTKNMDDEFSKDENGLTKVETRTTIASGKNTNRNTKRNQARKDKKKARQNNKRGRK